MDFIENACKIGLADKTDWITYQAILWRGVQSHDEWKTWLQNIKERIQNGQT